MPLFYFHLRTPEKLERDDTGLEFSGTEVAYLEACRTVPEMSADLVRRNRNPARYAFEITDAGDRLVMEVPFTEVLDRGRKPAVPSAARLLRTATAEMARTAYLISAIDEERAALQVTLAETRRLLRLSRQVSEA
jgi:hypothetical protein